MLNWEHGAKSIEAKSSVEHNGLPLKYRIEVGKRGLVLDGEGLVPAPVRFGRRDIGLAKNVAQQIETKIVNKKERGPGL